MRLAILEICWLLLYVSFPPLPAGSSGRFVLRHKWIVLQENFSTRILKSCQCEPTKLFASASDGGQSSSAKGCQDRSHNPIYISEAAAAFWIQEFASA